MANITNLVAADIAALELENKRLREQNKKHEFAIRTLSRWFALVSRQRDNLQAELNAHKQEAQ